MMTDTVTLAVIAAAAGIPALVIPILNAALSAGRDRRAREAQNVRDDVLQKRSDERADTLEARSQERAAEVARLLKTSNETAATGVVKLLAGQKQIHTLVNSDRTAGMQDQLDSREIALALLLELIEVKKGLAIPQQPSVETLATVEQMRASVLLLRKTVTDRLKQQELANEEAAKAAINLHIV